MRNESADAETVVASAIPVEKTRTTFLEEGALAYIVKTFNQFSLESLRRKRKH
jgi:hypothetical protein